MAERKRHLLAEIVHNPETVWSRLARFGLQPVSALAGHGSASRDRRVAIVVGLAAAISLTAAAVLGGMAATGGAAGQSHASVSATSVGDVIAEVENGFGDGVIQSASASGSTVTVQTSTPDGSAQAWAGFEAAVLGHAVADWQAAHGQTPATDLRALGSNGQSLSGMAFDVIGNDSSASALPGNACETAGQQVSAAVDVVSARTLPFAGGTCVFRVESTSADAVGAYNAVANAMSNALPSGATNNDYPNLIEVADASGSPLLVSTWVPGLGGGPGAGTTYLKPGLPGASSIIYGSFTHHR